MQKSESRFTVYFDNPFWVGVYERVSDGKLEVCKITFGTEPKDYEVYDFLLSNWKNLRFSSPQEAAFSLESKITPKRLQRTIKKQLKMQGVGTKSQQALKLQQEEGKLVRKQKKQQKKAAEKQRQFYIRQQKRKEKHRGR